MSNCPFCGLDPYHYVNNGVGMEAVAVTCCEFGQELFGHERPAEITLSREEFQEIADKLTSLRDKLNDAGGSDEDDECGDVAQAAQESIGYAPYHHTHGWRIDLASKSQQIATAYAMRNIDGAAASGWEVRPLYATPQPASNAYQMKEPDLERFCIAFTWAYGTAMEKKHYDGREPEDGHTPESLWAQLDEEDREFMRGVMRDTFAAYSVSSTHGEGK